MEIFIEWIHLFKLLCLANLSNILMCVLSHLLICTVPRAHIIVAEVLYEINHYYYPSPLRQLHSDFRDVTLCLGLPLPEACWQWMPACCLLSLQCCLVEVGTSKWQCSRQSQQNLPEARTDTHKKRPNKYHKWHHQGQKQNEKQQNLSISLSLSLTHAHTTHNTHTHTHTLSCLSKVSWHEFKIEPVSQQCLTTRAFLGERRAFLQLSCTFCLELSAIRPQKFFYPSAV